MFDQYPFVNQFNTVVAFVRIDSTGFVLDATNPHHAVNQLHAQCYNGGGWLVDTDAPDWFNIPAIESSQSWLGKLAIDENGQIKGHFTMNTGGALASSWRAELTPASAKDILRKEWEDTHLECELDSVKFTQIDVYDQPLRVDYNCQIPNAADNINGTLYLKPILDFYFTENPFKSLKRNFPVHFNHAIKSQYVAFIRIPDGYGIEEMPAAARLSLPNDAGNIRFSCTKVNAQEFQAQLKLQMNQLFFEPEAYESLRQFFNLLKEKIDAQVVLKKT
jgi:hypothetical protein